VPRLKSSLGCKEGAWHTIREAKRQLHFVVSSKSLSARERVQVIRFFEREHHGALSIPLPLSYRQSIRFQTAYCRIKKKKENFT